MIASAMTLISVSCAIIVIGLLLLQQEILMPTDVDKIEDMLPQTQCGDCGFHGCRPYAVAIANNSTDINRCMPGGIEKIKLLAYQAGAETKALYKKQALEKNRIAIIDEEHCIGCVKCISACPVDAIIGAPKKMHSIINVYCTGCELCLAPCPVDCISMVTR